MKCALSSKTPWNYEPNYKETELFSNTRRKMNGQTLIHQLCILSISDRISLYKAEHPALGGEIRIK